jgi:hypothetical protein
MLVGGFDYLKVIIIRLVIDFVELVKVALKRGGRKRGWWVS